MFIKRYLVILLSVVVLVSVLAACAAPSPTATPTSTPTLTPTQTPAGPLAEIIAGAKKEGAVSIMLATNYTPKSIERLSKEIKDRFGVELKISFTPSGNMAKEVATAIVEFKAAATPTYDLMSIGAENCLAGLPVGIFEILDWNPLLPTDTSPCVVVSILPYGQVGLNSYTTLQAVVYNPEKVRADEVPQTAGDLANPKWKGKLGVPNYLELWSTWAFVMGKEKTLADLRAIMKNGAIQGRFSDLLNRYLLGETWLTLVTAQYWKEAIDKGMPAGWQTIDFHYEAARPSLIRKGAAHPNAAKLVGLYLATPAGARFVLEESNSGNACYSGNYIYDLRIQAEKQGLPKVLLPQNKAVMDFLLSTENSEWQKEINVIFTTKY